MGAAGKNKRPLITERPLGIPPGRSTWYKSCMWEKATTAHSSLSTPWPPAPAPSSRSRQASGTLRGPTRLVPGRAPPHRVPPVPKVHRRVWKHHLRPRHHRRDPPQRHGAAPGHICRKGREGDAVLVTERTQDRVRTGHPRGKRTGPHRVPRPGHHPTRRDQPDSPAEHRRGGPNMGALGDSARRLSHAHGQPGHHRLRDLDHGASRPTAPPCPGRLLLRHRPRLATTGPTRRRCQRR